MDELEPPKEHPLGQIVAAGVPIDALAFFGRWWQLETWLRELVYVELRARYGEGWGEHLRGQAPKRASGDELSNAYMASADAGELIEYADVSDLFNLIEAEWAFFSHALPPRRRWEGAADELKELRNRNAHCRRPHRDDLARIEQLLRNLEAGAWAFYAQYLRVERVSDSDDPVAVAWIRGEDGTAARLLAHARRNYGTEFHLSVGSRPWAEPVDPCRASGHVGGLWHARWSISGRDLNALRFWQDIRGKSDITGPIVHLLVDQGSVTATLSTVDPPERVIACIGRLFDSILLTSRPFVAVESTEEWVERWRAGSERLPRRVQVESPLTLVDPFEHQMFSIFGAG